MRDANTVPPGTWTSTCSGGSVSQSRVARSTSSKSWRARSPSARASLAHVPAGAGERPRRIEQNRRANVGRQLAETVRGALRGERVGHRRQNRRVPLARISWLATVGICLVAALLLLLNGYYGYAGVLLAVGAAAAVNLL